MLSDHALDDARPHLARMGYIATLSTLATLARAYKFETLSAYEHRRTEGKAMLCNKD